MKQATKGALAAVTAVALLSGGAGTLAYWTGTQDVTGGAISSGKLTLSQPVCDGTDDDAATHEWQFDGGDEFTGTSTIVPGDTLTKVCNMTLTLVGDHIGATLDLDAATFANTSNAHLKQALNGATADFTVDDGDYAPLTEAGAYQIQATVTVPFPATVTAGNTQDVAAALKDMTLTAAQTHEAPASTPAAD